MKPTIADLNLVLTLLAFSIFGFLMYVRSERYRELFENERKLNKFLIDKNKKEKADKK